MRPVNRPSAQLPVQAMKTYEIIAPISTHWRSATCVEVDCEPHQNGWATTVTVDSDDESILRKAAAGQIDGIERRFIKGQADLAGFVQYVFPAGQPCFKAATHRVPLEREPLHVVRGGDWRANTGTMRQHVRGEDWVDDFATHQDNLKRDLGV